MFLVIFGCYGILNTWLVYSISCISPVDVLWDEYD